MSNSDTLAGATEAIVSWKQRVCISIVSGGLVILSDIPSDGSDTRSRNFSGVSTLGRFDFFIVSILFGWLVRFCVEYNFSVGTHKPTFSYNQQIMAVTQFRDSAGRLHRDGDMPAEIWPDGTKVWFQHGLKHRDGDMPSEVLEAKGTASA